MRNQAKNYSHCNKYSNCEFHSGEREVEVRFERQRETSPPTNGSKAEGASQKILPAQTENSLQYLNSGTLPTLF